MDLLEKELGRRSAVCIIDVLSFIFSTDKLSAGLSVRELANRMLHISQANTNIQS